MVIHKDRISGYNNTLYRASEKGMRFGVNSGLNYHKPQAVPKKTHQSGGSHLDDIDEPRVPHSKPVKENIKAPAAPPLVGVTITPQSWSFLES